MKDEHDNCTAELIDLPSRSGGGGAARARLAPPAARRLVVDAASSNTRLPACARLGDNGNGFGGAFVPVSFVAKDWGVTSRRIRFLLSAGRLDGRQLENGYWEVRYPYLFSFGTSGPALKRQRKRERRPE